MIERACPYCHGSVHYESYLAQGEKVREFKCINCSRFMTPVVFYRLGNLHRDCPAELECSSTRLTVQARKMMYRIGFRIPLQLSQQSM